MYSRQGKSLENVFDFLTKFLRPLNETAAATSNPGKYLIRPKLFTNLMGSNMQSLLEFIFIF